MDVSIVVLRYFGPDIFVIWVCRLVFLILSLNFILDYNLTLQACTNISSHNETTRSLLGIINITTWITAAVCLIYHIECIWSTIRRHGSSSEIKRLLDAILTDIWGSELLHLPVQRRSTSIIQHRILCKLWWGIWK